MEILNTHITEEKAKWLWEQEEAILVTLSDQTYIGYGEGNFNNPMNLPVIHTHNKGGIIVCFKDDINIYIVSKDEHVGKKFLDYIAKYLNRKGKAVILGNDLLYEGKKVASYSVLSQRNRYITTAHISMGMDEELVRSICTKPVFKMPGGLKNFGYTRQELLNRTLKFLHKIDKSYQSNNDPIDICVMWVNPKCKKWVDEYNYWKDVEIARGTQLLTNKAAFSDARYRDWGLFRYWFRAVEKNCPWVNKVFLVLEDEDQVPDWINKDNPKLRIVYHREFIPNEALPQFNGPAIETWYSNIPDLSENFISCDDDYYFIGSIAEDLFFENNIPQTEIIKAKEPIIKSAVSNWQQLMYNDYLLYTKITGKNISYKKSHLPEPRKKSFEAKILKDYYNDFYNALMYSHFRSDHGLTAWIFNDLIKALGVAEDKDIFEKSRYIGLYNNLFLKAVDIPYSQLQMVCFNDVGTDPALTQPLLLNIFEKYFPNKSSFEL